VIYVEELIGPDTVNTMPLATVEAFADHGVAQPTVDSDLDEARATLEQLHDAGVDLDRITDHLQTEGVDKFTQSFDELISSVGEKLQRVAGRV
jgi:transaldolase/transaldolase/glucose-6-phosphate isomerase